MAFSWRRANPLGALKLLRSHRELFGLASVNFLGMLAHAVLPIVSVLYLFYRYGWDERAVGFVLAAVGVTAMVVQGALIGPAIKRFGERTSLIVGLLFGVAGFFVYGIASTGIAVLRRHSAAGAVGDCEPGVACADEPACRRRRAGPAAGREREHPGHREHARSRTVLADICAMRSGPSSASRSPARRFSSPRLMLLARWRSCALVGYAGGAQVRNFLTR